MIYTIKVEVYEIGKEEYMKISEVPIYDYSFKYRIIEGYKEIKDFAASDVEQAIKLTLSQEFEDKTPRDITINLKLELCLEFYDYEKDIVKEDNDKIITEHKSELNHLFEITAEDKTLAIKRKIKEMLRNDSFDSRNYKKLLKTLDKLQKEAYNIEKGVDNNEY